MLEISAGGFDFVARFEEADAPHTVAAFRTLLPLESKIIHVRWSGEGGWIPLQQRPVKGDASNFEQVGHILAALAVFDELPGVLNLLPG